jgi:hypothetical protein
MLNTGAVRVPGSLYSVLADNFFQIRLIINYYKTIDPLDSREVKDNK